MNERDEHPLAIRLRLAKVFADLFFLGVGSFALVATFEQGGHALETEGLMTQWQLGLPQAMKRSTRLPSQMEPTPATLAVTAAYSRRHSSRRWSSSAEQRQGFRRGPRLSPLDASYTKY
jgi:hypothetical protein